MIGPECSVWFGTVVRGDVNWVRIGAQVNLQDGVICHVTINRAPLTIEDCVSVGHGAIVHGCTLRRGCLVGIGARVLALDVVGEESLIAAGSVVLESTIVPPGELWAGIPAKKKRDLSPEERLGLLSTAARYVQYRLHYQGQDAPIRDEWLPKGETCYDYFDTPSGQCTERHDGHRCGEVVLTEERLRLH